MSNIRDISVNPGKLLMDNNSNLPFNLLEKLSHMMIGKNKIDLDLATNSTEYYAAERICKNPRKQRIDEIRQFKDLANVFEGFVGLKRASIFLENGKRCVKEEIATLNPPDCDGEIIADQSILFSCKSQIGNGGSQDKQFIDIINFCNNASW